MFRTLRIVAAAAIVAVIGNTAFAAEPRAVPPNMIGLMLTPTGYDGKVYAPGQVDIGRESWGGYGNRLVLIQRSGYYIKEQFLETVPGDEADHRCTVGQDQEPVDLDVRLLFAMPNPDTDDGQQAILRMGLLGNPVPHPNAAMLGGDRVMLLDAESIYAEQVRNQVRGKIRDVCLRYENADAIFMALAKNGTADGFGDEIQREVAQVLADNNSPLLLVAAVVSNVKPDEEIINARISKIAAVQLVEAMTTIDDFLNEDPTGQRAAIYKLMMMQSMVNSGGSNTMMMTDLGFGANGMPIPVPVE